MVRRSRSISFRRRLAIVAALVAVLGATGVLVWRFAKPRTTQRAKVAPLRAAEKPAAKSDKVSIKGTLYDEERGTPIAAVKVVLLGPAGEVSATTAADGTFAFSIAPGRYRAFVRDTDWITSGLRERIRLDDGPNPRVAGALDADLAPLVVAETDLNNIELTTVRGARVSGRVYDEDGNPVAGAAVRMRQPLIARAPAGSASQRLQATTSFLHPVLGTDTAITDDLGAYSIIVPPGIYEVGLRHDNFAGTYNVTHANVGAGARVDQHIVAVKGCIVRGKVVTADGTPAPDGAIEVDDTGGQRFGPMARVAVDGTFEFSTLNAGFMRVRAWPWRSAPSNVREVYCDDGKRFDNIVLKLESRGPSIAGTLTDARGERVPFTFVDLQAVAPPDNSGQQERTDAAGEWHFYDVEPGQYRITVAAEGRGVSDINLVAPKTDVQLQLSGVGRISGTTAQLVDGSIQVAFLQCGNDTNGIEMPPETQIVPVRGGRFTIDGAPACTLRFHARWRQRTTEATVVVEPNGTSYVALDLGAPHEKAVRGIVRNAHGAPAANVAVTALIDEREASTVRTDKDGRFTITTRSGAQLLARSAGKVGRGSVGNANVASEIVDIVLDSDALEP